MYVFQTSFPWGADAVTRIPLHHHPLSFRTDHSPAGLLNQAQNLATQAVNTASDLTNKAVNSQAAATATEGAKALGAQAASAAGAAATTIGSLATQAQEHASAVAPSIIPPPAGGAGVDTRGDLSPTNEADRAKLDKLFAERAEAKELQEKGILKGTCCVYECPSGRGDILIL